eukprot:gene4456-4712_t
MQTFSNVYALSYCIQVQEAASGSVRQRFSMNLLPGGRIVEVVESAKQPPSSSSSSNAAQATATLLAAIPSRFCGVQASTAGGDITLAELQEAELQLVTEGGQVQVQRCRATNAAINTARSPGGDGITSLPGGSIQAPRDMTRQRGITSSEASCGVLPEPRDLLGSCLTLHIGRLFGLEVEVLTGGSPLVVGALYGGKASLGSSGGDLQIQ